MSKLSIQSHPEMGPLEVTIYPVEGDPIEVALSSSATSADLDLPAGRYAIVARRPNGTRIRRLATVPHDAVVDLEGAGVGASSADTAVERGLLVEKRATSKSAAGSVLVGDLGRSMSRGVIGALIRKAESLERFADGIDPDAIGEAVYDRVIQAGRRWMEALKGPRQLALCVWRLSPAGWEEVSTDLSNPVAGVEVTAELLKLTLNPRRDIFAVGLIDDLGFGPIVMVPPFAEPVSLAFLAEGLGVHAHNRDRTPGGLRTPVALVTPTQGAVADLLSALNALRAPLAEALWLQTEGGLALDTFVLEASPAEPVEMLRNKFQRPAEALIAAHYLLRFMPQRLPLAWADNLSRALPQAADGPVIAAWARMSGASTPAGSDIDAEVSDLLKEALGRPVVLFARTRLLLSQALRFAPGIAEAGSVAQEPFRRAGADAGGLEAYWGGHPSAGGRACDLPPGWKADVELSKKGFGAKPRLQTRRTNELA